jgi:16S rRNA (cytidine1402-2'-O)-methyltransferase
MADDRDTHAVLYVVATPIGNLEDISRRAVDVLSQVKLIAAEDTRRTLSLLNAIGVARPKMLALHDHNEQAASDAVLSILRGGESVALVSDAGTPLLSDPGFELVRRCYDEHFRVHPLPGPSAVSAALSVCPLPSAGFRFVGFLPAKASGRQDKLRSLIESGDPVVFFEAPHRLRDCLHELDRLAGDRRVFLAREMTKLFETYLCALPRELIDILDRDDQWRGEMVCVLEGKTRTQAVAGEEAGRVMAVLAKELAPAQAARLGAALLGVPKSALYELAQKYKGRGAD